ncbi:MAG: N-ATPase subunit AtpR [Planctomycetota bacterium]|jgi:F1F0 ATPase subunit 2
MSTALTAVVIGAGLGLLATAVHLGGAWWTARRVPQARHPALLLVLSLSLRLTAVAVAAWLAVVSGPLALIVLLLVLMILRHVVVRAVAGGQGGGDATQP